MAGVVGVSVEVGVGREGAVLRGVVEVYVLGVVVGKLLRRVGRAPEGIEDHDRVPLGDRLVDDRVEVDAHAEVFVHGRGVLLPGAAAHAAQGLGRRVAGLVQGGLAAGDGVVDHVQEVSVVDGLVDAVGKLALHAKLGAVFVHAQLVGVGAVGIDDAVITEQTAGAQRRVQRLEPCAVVVAPEEVVEVLVELVHVVAEYAGDLVARRDLIRGVVHPVVAEEIIARLDAQIAVADVDGLGRVGRVHVDETVCQEFLPCVAAGRRAVREVPVYGLVQRVEVAAVSVRRGFDLLPEVLRPEQVDRAADDRVGRAVVVVHRAGRHRVRVIAKLVAVVVDRRVQIVLRGEAHDVDGHGGECGLAVVEQDVAVDLPLGRGVKGERQRRAVERGGHALECGLAGGVGVNRGRRALGEGQHGERVPGGGVGRVVEAVEREGRLGRGGVGHLVHAGGEYGPVLVPAGGAPGRLAGRERADRQRQAERQRQKKAQKSFGVHVCSFQFI